MDSSHDHRSKVTMFSRDLTIYKIKPKIQSCICCITEWMNESAHTQAVWAFLDSIYFPVHVCRIKASIMMQFSLVRILISLSMSPSLALPPYRKVALAYSPAWEPIGNSWNDSVSMSLHILPYITWTQMGFSLPMQFLSPGSLSYHQHTALLLPLIIVSASPDQNLSLITCIPKPVPFQDPSIILTTSSVTSSFGN